MPAQYCFLLTDVDEIEHAAEVLIHVREASVFRQVEARQNALRWGLIGRQRRIPPRLSGVADPPARPACYLRANKYDQLVTEFRYFMLGHQGETEPLRLFLAILSHGQRAMEAFNHPRFLKFAIRQLKLVEHAVLGSAGDPGKSRQRSASSPIVDRMRKGKERPQDQDPREDAADADEEAEAMLERGTAFKPTKLSPVWMAMYGMMLNVAQSPQPAISTCLRMPLRRMHLSLTMLPDSLPLAHLRTRQEAAARQLDPCNGLHPARHDPQDRQQATPDRSGMPPGSRESALGSELLTLADRAGLCLPGPVSATPRENARNRVQPGACLPSHRYALKSLPSFTRPALPHLTS